MRPTRISVNDTIKITLSLTVLALGAVTLVATSGPADSRPHPAAPASRPVKHLTPDDCIRVNGGDFNACNVGNSGRGDLPYRPAH